MAFFMSSIDGKASTRKKDRSKRTHTFIFLLKVLNMKLVSIYFNFNLVEKRTNHIRKNYYLVYILPPTLTVKVILKDILEIT